MSGRREGRKVTTVKGEYRQTIHHSCIRHCSGSLCRILNYHFCAAVSWTEGGSRVVKHNG